MSLATAFKVLSFNWHEPYLCMMAKTGHHFFVVEPKLADENYRRWDERMRPLPENITLIQPEEVDRCIKDIDVIVCHNIKDVLEAAKYRPIPKVMVFHNRLSTEIELGGSKVSADEYREKIKSHLEGIDLVFISEGKKKDWGLEGGRVILPGIDPFEYGGYQGQLETILRVGNLLKERDLMLGYTEQEKICELLPTTILGQNPTLNSRLSSGWADLQNHYKWCRIFLNTTKQPYEDGYNLALLEAMATGMPILSLANSTSPITDGIEGYISDDIGYLREQAQMLLKDQEKARDIGKLARDTVFKKFPIKTFIKSWKKVIETAAKRKPKVNTGLLSDMFDSSDILEVTLSEKKTEPVITKKPLIKEPAEDIKTLADQTDEEPAVKKNETKACNIWIDYVYYPATTAHYLKRAIQSPHSVVTSGGSITREVIEMWNLGNMKAEIKEQDIPRSAASSASSIFEMIPKDKKPEFFLWVETGLDGPPNGIESLPIPRVAYFIDTHINLDSHIQAAKRFDIVFLAQRKYIDAFKDSGIKHVFWLPLACDPEIHGKKNVDVIREIGFVGSITPAHQRRKQLLEHLDANGCKVDVQRLFLEEMTEHFSASKIGFNNAIKDDLNMRVFEALCSGTMLLTDKADGLTEFFEDKKHLVIYNDSDIAKTAKHYLANDDERLAIAEAGRKEVLANHTYRHRVEQIIKTVREVAKERAVPRVGKAEAYYSHARVEVIEFVPESAMKILEIGCGAGSTGKLLKEQNKGREVVGVEFNKEAAKSASGVLDKVFTGDIEKLTLPYPKRYFDAIIYADVLEHLNNPEALLKKHKQLLKDDGLMVMSIPNVQHFTVINQLMAGRWTYTDEGLLDRTHLRFFTLYEIRQMLERLGLSNYEVHSKTVDNHYKEGASGTLRIGRWQVGPLNEDEMLGFFAFQYIIRAARKVGETVNDKPDIANPSRFKKMLEDSNLFNEETDDPLVKAGVMAMKGGNGTPVVLPNLSDETESERVLFAGHLNMVLGKFSQAEEFYKKADNKKLLGLSYAARGLLYKAFEIWWPLKDDAGVAELIETYSKGDDKPERFALLPVEGGEGVRLNGMETFDAGKMKGLDYITSINLFENDPDPVGTLCRWKDSLKDGGLIGLVLPTPEADSGGLHLFSIDGFKNLVELVNGISLVYSGRLLGASFIAVLQKGGGRSGFNYKKSLNAISAERAVKQSMEHWEAHNTEASLQAAQSALELDETNYYALSKLGDCMQKMGNPAGALAHYRNSLKIADSETGRIGIGTLCLGSLDFKQAHENFEAAVKINPDNDRAVCGLGMARYHLGEKEEGFGLYMNAVALNPENIPAIMSILHASYELKRLDAAEDALKNYLELHPANLDMLFGLAGVQFQQEKMEEAEDTLSRILLFEQDHESAVSLMEKVKEAKAAK